MSSSSTSAPAVGILFAEERHQEILARIRQTGKVTVEELAAMYAVSLPTIRADLARLEEQGLLRRTHGGAIPASATLFEPPYSQREVMHHPEKKAIAAAAAEMVKDGETIILDAGTTVYEFALALRGRKSLTVVTNSLVNAQALSDSAGVEVILIGGTIQPHRRATLGPLAVRFLESFHVDRAFLAFNGVHPEAGFTVVDFHAAEIKRQMMARAVESIVLSDASKLGKTAFARVAAISSASTIITDSSVDPQLRSDLAAQGITIVLAE
jgi:DeoR/GlpR family transcriptional regulator of sugar metabolism